MNIHRVIVVVLIASMIGAFIPMAIHFFIANEPIIFDPPIQADETKGLEDIQLKNFMDSRLKRISWPQYIVIMFGYPDVQKQFLLKYTLLFPIMFLTSCACCFLYLRKKSANKGIQADAAEPRG